MKKFKAAILCSAVILAAALTGCGSGRAVSRKVYFSPQQDSEIKVMTFNIRTRTIIDGPNHWNHRKKLVTDIIASNRADVIGLQEAKNSQFEYIETTLPQYGTYAVGRSNGVRGGESCPILYRKDRFTAIEADTFWFSDTPSVAGSKDWGNMPPRICTWMHLVDKQSGTGFYVYNVHLDHRSQNSREKSVRLLATKIAGRRTRDPFIILGDFNMERNNSAMVYLNRVGSQNPLVRSNDAWQWIHPNQSIGTRHGFGGSISGPQIDHIRISPKLQALDVRIDARQRNGRYPSDHFPVIAKLLLGSRGPLVQNSRSKVFRQVRQGETVIHSGTF